MPKLSNQLIANSHITMKIVVDFLKSEFFPDVISCFNKWTRQAIQGHVNFATLNASITEMETINIHPLDLRKVMATCDVETCVSASEKGFDTSSNHLGSLLDNLEMMNQFDFDNKEADLSQSREQSPFFISFLIRIPCKWISRRLQSSF